MANINFLEEAIMGKVKVVRCSDAGLDCNYVGRSESEEELLKEVAKHAKEVHGMEINDELIQKVKSIMHEEEYAK